MFDGVYNKRRCLITGHTGFKGSYLNFWLARLGAEVCGVALPMSEPCHHTLLDCACENFFLDIRDRDALMKVFAGFQPEIVFHLAAQPLVRLSYRTPVETFETNFMGTVNVLECCRQTPSVRSVVVVTTDKCYENPENGLPFKESDPLGGYDPYSGSKAAAEIAAASYRRSFFSAGNTAACATARAGNVIGGGDWAADRLIPDMVRGAAAGKVTKLRNPDAVRPWQHVLEPLSGYLQLGAGLFQQRAWSGSWNFGPAGTDTLTVGEVAGKMHLCWEKMDFQYERDPEAPHEAALLSLDCSKAAREMGWRGVWDCSTAVEYTVRWYREFYENGKIMTENDLACYCRDAEKRGLAWTR